MKAAANIAVGVAIAAAAGGLAGCRPGQDYVPLILPACVSGFQAGDSLTVRLGAVYDAKSDYLFEYENFGPLSYGSVPSCGGLDGVATGSVVTFKLTGPADGSGAACSPWMAAFEPDVVSNKEPASVPLPYLDGVTIADATAFGTIDGHEVFAGRGLFTPSGDAYGAFVTATLPPLAVTRRLGFLDRYVVDNQSDCFDAWVATWEPPP